MPAFGGGRHLLRESRGEGRRKPATPPAPWVDVDSPRLDRAMVFLGALSFLDTKRQKKLVPIRMSVNPLILFLDDGVIAVLTHTTAYAGRESEKRPLALVRRGFFPDRTVSTR